MTRFSTIAVRLVAAIVGILLVVDAAAARPGGGGRGGPRPGAGSGHQRPTPSKPNPGSRNLGDKPGVKQNLGGLGGTGLPFTPGQSNINRPNSQDLRNHLNGDVNRDPRFGADHRNQPGDRNGQYASQFQQQSQQIRSNLQTQADNLFTPQWYAQHPNAWQATHPHADAWAVASFATVAAWVGIAGQPAAYGAGYSDGGYEEGYGDGYSEGYTEGVSAETTDLASAQNGSENAGDWMPLGVFALAPAGQGTAFTYVQLAVDKQGALSGTYFDTASDSGQPLHGSLSKQTQKVAWKVGQSNSAVFETSVASLTADQARLTVYFPGGKSQTWTMVRADGQKGSPAGR